MSPGREELAAIRGSVELVGRLTDGLLRIGPFRLGAEAALDWIPGVGEIYGSAAAIFLLVQGVRAQVPMRTLIGCAGLMFGRTLIAALPVAGPLAADALALHGLSARLIIRAIDRRLAETVGPARPMRRSWRGRRPAAVAV
ncbi:MAG TPA: DUF4112 domain-containing protein [Caulobacteraceae bacterium]|jgi:hypothetical protein